MKLLLATQDFPPVEGGMARYYADLAAGFPAGSVVVSTVLAEGKGGPAPADLLIHREAFPLARAHRLAARLAWEVHLQRLLHSEAPDHLVCGNLRPLGPIVQRLARRHGLPYLVVFHGNDLLAAHRRWRGLRRPTWTRVLSGAAHWVANSRAVARLAVEDCGLPAERGIVLPPEVDTARFRPAADAAEAAAERRARGLPADEVLILYVGRLIRRKGLDRVLEAAAALDREEGLPAWRVIVAGFGEAAPYREAAARLEITPRVRFLGAVPDAGLPGLYRACDLLCMPSRTRAGSGDVEGFGIVYLEAAAAGLPAVAGCSGGAPEAVTDGETGLVVDGEDAGEVAAALRSLLLAPGFRAALGRSGRARAVASFGPGSMAARLSAALSRPE